MNYPIDEQIVQAVQTALESISTLNGYATTITDVVRPRRTGEDFAPKDMGLALRVIRDSPTGEGTLAPPSAERILTLGCDVCVRLSEKDERPMDQVLSIVKADVVKAVMTERTWGGLAAHTTIGAETYYADGGGFEGVIVEIDIEYATALDNKYTNMI